MRTNPGNTEFPSEISVSPGLFTRRTFLTAYIPDPARSCSTTGLCGQSQTDEAASRRTDRKKARAPVMQGPPPPKRQKVRKMMNGFFKSVAENAVFAAEFLLIIVAVFLVALVLEKLAYRKNSGGIAKERVFATRRMAVTGMFSAIALILFLFEFPLPFAPSFYELDFSELPALVGAFAFGPVTGVIIEVVKILLKLLIKGTSTAFVGDLANFVIGCSFILPASAIYHFNKKKKSAIAGCIIGTLILTLFGTAFNAIYLLPAFSRLYGMPLDTILDMGSAVNPLMTKGSIVSFVVCCVAPMNLIKGGSVSLITMLIYKPLSPIIKAGKQ